MALVVFLRGMNVGGRRTFRPSVLAKQMSGLDTSNVGAAGTLVIRKPGSRTNLLAALRGYLPVETTIALCDGRDLLRLEAKKPFTAGPLQAEEVPFVSILSEDATRSVALSLTIPEDSEWFVHILGVEGRLDYGVYRRKMKTIGYLGQLDRLFGVPATTRSWSTINSVVRLLRRDRAVQVSPGPDRSRQRREQPGATQPEPKVQSNFHDGVCDYLQ